MPKMHWETPVYSREIGMDMMISYDAQNRNEYIGYANPGSLTSSAVWQIFRLTYDPTSGGVATRRYANRSDDFNQIWDNRESLNYTD